jgi:hypothetical protein
VRYCFYHQDTGIFHPVVLTTDDERQISVNTPADHVAIEGSFDPPSKKVDIATGQIVDFVPPQPSPDHEWDETTRRWVLNAAAADRNARRTAALARIAELEHSVQPGLLRAVALGQEGAKEKLAALDAEIAKLREGLRLRF